MLLYGKVAAFILYGCHLMQHLEPKQQVKNVLINNDIIMDNEINMSVTPFEIFLLIR